MRRRNFIAVSVVGCLSSGAPSAFAPLQAGASSGPGRSMSIARVLTTQNIEAGEPKKPAS